MFGTRVTAAIAQLLQFTACQLCTAAVHACLSSQGHHKDRSLAAYSHSKAVYESKST